MYWNTSNPLTGQLLSVSPMGWLTHLFYFSLHNSPLMSSVATGVPWLLTCFPRVPFLSLLVSSQKQLQLRPYWPTSKQYPFAPSFTFSLTDTLCRCSEVAWSKHSWGSQCSPVSECLRGNLFRSSERGNNGGIEYQFCSSLLGQSRLLYDLKKT